MSKDYTCSITANITAKEAFESITHVSGWWAKNVKGNSKDLNDTFTVLFGKTFGTIKITEMVADKKIEWQVVDCYLDLFKDKTQWKDTKIIWEISTENKATQISMTHVGLVPEIECYTDCEKGWNFFITESLFQLMTRHKGLPATGIRATIANADRTYEGTIFSKEDPLPGFSDEQLLIDVKETRGEQVISSYAVNRLDKETFNIQQIKGDHYMLVENKPLFGEIQPLEDLLETIK